MGFEIDGVPFARSIISKRSHRAAACEFLLDVRPETLELALEVLAKESTHNVLFSGLRITGLDDIEFLRDYPLLLYLEAEDVSKGALRCIESLSNLRGLRLDAPKGGIDFSGFPHLEEFFGDWNPNNTGIGACGELRKFRAFGFRTTEQGVLSLAGCVRLEELGLTRPRIACLDGIEALEDLRYLSIAYAPKIEDLTPLAAPTVNLREISLTNLKRISDYSPIASIRRLRRLKIFKCAPMADLTWTDGMDYLDFISFVETRVLDGDLSPLLSLPVLRYVGAGNRRDYSHSDDELNDLINTSWRSTLAAIHDNRTP